MKNQIRLSVVSAASVLALLLSASAFLLVGAQEPTPTETLEPSASETASETPAPSETPTAEASSPTAEASSTETPTSEFTATETATPISETPTSTPTETVSPTITPTPVLEGPPAQISAITSASVIWCPATVASPQDGLVGCTAAKTTLLDLYVDLSTLDPNVDGTIWVGLGYEDLTNTNVTFDGAFFQNMDTRKLSVKGGWIGTGGTINSGAPSEIGHYLQFENWGNDVTMSNLLISNPNGGDNLAIATSGKITLTNIQSTNALSGLRGATLNNTSGVADVIITGGSFFANGAAGLLVLSDGAITLNNVSIYDNNDDGAQLNNELAPTPKNVTITNSSSNDNTGLGFNVETDGNMMVSGSTASGNGSWGAYFHHDSGGPTASNCNFTSSTFNTNGNTNLEVDCNGNITLTNVTANGSTGGSGAELDGSFSNAVKNVSLAGANEFNNNWNEGLYVATEGAILVNDVTASSNGVSTVIGIGANLNALGPVTLTGTNIFSSNYVLGLAVTSAGPIKVNNVIANSNLSGSGAWLDNSGATAQGVTLTGSSQFSYNGSLGLEIDSAGAVMANNITANANEGFDGVNVDNSCACSSAAVTFTGTNTFLENWENGLYVLSNGAMTISNVTADDNGVSTTDGYGVYLESVNVTTAQKVTLSGVNSINNNLEGNLWILTKGAVAINSVTANGSLNGSGIEVDNQLGGATTSKQPITLTGTNVASENDDFGFSAVSYGMITINSLSANDNGGPGGQLKNELASTPMGITLKGVNSFSDNVGIGLEIITDGAIMANSVSADDNGDYGVQIGDPDGVPDPIPYASAVTFTGINSFDSNGQGGLYVNTFGAIALSNVSANDNLVNHGIELDNRASTDAAPKNVTFSGVNSANNNTIHGVLLNTYGDVIVNSLTASDNDAGSGAVIYNSTGTIMKKVTFTGSNVFNDNVSNGLLVESQGMITVSNLSASGNNFIGAWLQNTAGTAHAGITVTGVNTFNNNTFEGLRTDSEGPIVVSNLYANGNQSPGYPAIGLYNHGSDNAQKVTVSGISVISGNQGNGLDISSKGAVTVNSLTATANLVGLDINNAQGSAGSAQAVMLTGTNVFTGNASGIEVDSYGPISVANATASNNTGGAGALLQNNGSTLPQKVTLTGMNTFNGNAGHGVQVISKGAITSATRMTANGNTAGDGVNLSNSGAGSTAEINLKGTNIANNNYSSGFTLESRGAITVNNVTAKDNGITGALEGFGLFLNNTSAVPVKDVKMTGTNVLTWNYEANLFIGSAGAITTNNLTGGDSVTGHGAEIANTTEGKAVTLTGNNYFNNNNLSGLDIESLGPITTNNINASLNGSGPLYPGAVITNDGAPGLARAVKMNGTNVFVDNTGFGLSVISNGAVTLNNVRSHFNDQGGLLVENIGPGNPALTLTGTNAFRNNVLGGVNIDSDGVVTVNKMTAEGNGGTGLFVNPTLKNITLMCGTFTNNGFNGGGWGVDVETTAIFKRIGVFASGNNTGNINFTGPNPAVIVRNCP